MINNYMIIKIFLILSLIFLYSLFNYIRFRYSITILLYKKNLYNI